MLNIGWHLNLNQVMNKKLDYILWKLFYGLKNTDVYLTVKDKKNDTANTFSLDVDTVADGSDFNFFFKVENLKVMEGNYDVEISSKNISHLKSTNKDVEYWVALEPESSYE